MNAADRVQYASILTKINKGRISELTDDDYLWLKKRKLSSNDFLYGGSEFIDIQCLKGGEIVHTTHVSISHQTYDVRVGFFYKISNLLKGLGKKNE